MTFYSQKLVSHTSHLVDSLPETYRIDLHMNRWGIILRILHECSCFIEFIKKLGKRDNMRGAGMLDLITLISCFCRKTVMSVSLCTQRC